MNFRITYWKSENDEPRRSEDWDMEECQDTISNATSEFIAGAAATAYGVYPCDDGEEIMLVEIEENGIFRLMSGDEIRELYNYDDSGLVVSFEGFKTGFRIQNEDFIEGLRYFQQRIDPSVFWK